MLTVDHVTKKYGKVVACDDLSFHLDPGSVTVLLGPNGAGKSTIMKAIIGFLRYDGSITVGGYPNKTTQARWLLGYIPEMPALYPNLTVSEHMEFIARAYRMSGYKERIDVTNSTTSAGSSATSCPRACSRNSTSASGFSRIRACFCSTSR